ncbi:MAG: response regulator [Gammaproteobacteria bacterium]|nr:response regulator [Gammaproteobacteria bacterium]
MRITFSKTARLSLLVIIILAISLAFLYLMQRQQIYNNVKETSRNLIEQETLYYDQLTQEWSNILTVLSKHGTFRLFVNAYSKDKLDFAPVYREQLEKVFNEVAQFRLSHIQYVRFIGADGMEEVVSENGKPYRQYTNLAGTSLFAQGINQPEGELSKIDFEKVEGNAYINRSIPIYANGKKQGLLAITIDLKLLLDKYQYLLASNVTDHVMVLNKQGGVLFQTNKIQPAASEIKSVVAGLKQTTAKYPILEDRQNVWSFAYNKPYNFYILFQTNGKRITAMLNEEYRNLGLVFSISSFILVLLVFWSTRHLERKEVHEASKKVMSQQRSVHFASVSDEIRPPINALLGSLMTLTETELDKKQYYYADTAKKSAECLLVLVNEFQDYSRISRGEFALEKIEFDLRATVHDISELMSAQAYKKGLEVSCLVGADVPKRVVGDATRLRQIMINLMSFAVEYTNQGEISICISADDVDHHNKLVHIEIIDTGNVVGQDTMQEHFKMFTDPKLQDPEKYSSEGLGLALSKQLVELMDGQISVEENSSGGNTFKITLPMPFAMDVEPAKPKVSLTGKHVLILGEIETNRTSLSHAFSKWGMSGASMEEFPRVVNVLREAKIANKAYDVCMVDVSLTSSSDKAFKAVRKIRQEFSEDELGIIILTVQGAAGDLRKARELGVQAYLTKPISRNTMRQTLHQVLDNRLDQTAQIVTRHSLKEGEHKNISRVLAAESDERTQKRLAKYFNKVGYQVDFAENGQKVKAAIADHVYSLILCDVKLPQLDVFKFVKEYRKEELVFNLALNSSPEKHVHVPIIGLVKNKDKSIVSQCDEAGMDKLLAKPVSDEEIQLIVERYLTKVEEPDEEKRESEVEV